MVLQVSSSVVKSKEREDNFCSIEKLKTVKGTNTIGGFVGSILSGSAAEVNIGSNERIASDIIKTYFRKSG